ncbi:hypothetical protein [Pseudomonas sp. LP_7_YM]|uniref:hypothetical protein n=1 Tax=Pseudomonas sp. LP_7_YM TaxID=2485137 RepID=UPI0010E1E325|nr:hypothetical protein [Pseudomonas sp. LP_7_YM]TDV62621.1 hypothetical protein EC915_107207 [Pseudomonas sp. LP_7_YM]
MKIACLGWGSLIWKPGVLPVASHWFNDGPELPIEFSRVGDGGELATAICLNAPACQVLWAMLATESLDEAVRALRVREQIPAERSDGVGIFTINSSTVGLLGKWAADRQLDAVIWTALPPRFDDNEGLIPSLDDVLAYLISLDGDTLEHAKSYMEQVPEQIDTPYRREIKKLGWD